MAILDIIRFYPLALVPLCRSPPTNLVTYTPLFTAPQAVDEGPSTPVVTKTSTLTTYSASTIAVTGTNMSTKFTSSTVSSSAMASVTDVVKEVGKEGGFWVVAGVAKFQRMATYTFSGHTLPDGLMASHYPVHDRSGNQSIPYNHKFHPENVKLSGGFLHLVVPGKQNLSLHGFISCAEIQTTETQITAASVRVKATFSSEPGTCHGLFFYRSDSQEIDIEYLTDSASSGNDGDHQPIPIWYSNQAVEEGKEATQNPIIPPDNIDPTSGVHEHRIDWTPNFTAFYFDGNLRARFTDNIPTEPGPWVFNNWANGDPHWSVGPPCKDSILKIQSITMYYNTSSTKGQC